METLFTITVLIFAILTGYLLGFAGFIVVFLVGVIVQTQINVKKKQHEEILKELRRIKNG